MSSQKHESRQNEPQPNGMKTTDVVLTLLCFVCLCNLLFVLL